MSLEEAEVAMLELYCERAELQDGQDVLELGCGWGSLCLYLAQKYPRSRITAGEGSSCGNLRKASRRHDVPPFQQKHRGNCPTTFVSQCPTQAPRRPSLTAGLRSAVCGT